MKLPNSYYNPISFFGSLLAGFTLLIIAFVLFLSVFFEVGGAYTGVMIYLVSPMFLILGLAMIPIGMVRKKRKELKGNKEITTWKVIDLNRTRTRNAMIIFVIGTFVLIFVSSIGSYQTFHYTESNEFCGTLCHTVMKPEYTAHQNTAHAQVHCVECHVGSGASGYAKAKFSGLYQVYSVITNKYPRPIETPVHSIRSATETCEKCHWPDKPYVPELKDITTYMTDKNNTEWNISLKIKTGTSANGQETEKSIHWHIDPNVQIDYVSDTKNSKSIPWVRYINLETGDTTIFKDENSRNIDALVDSLPARTMDCLDCHNRPAHRYSSPTTYIDQAFNNGTLPQDLPFLKGITMEVLYGSFTNTDSAVQYIRKTIREKYEKRKMLDQNETKINQAIDVIIEAFKQNNFPEMQVSNKEYIEHIGHRESLGCFRCHSDTHSSDDGRVISQDCNLCHDILAQGTDNNMQFATLDSTLTFEHPDDIGTDWLDMPCSECHIDLYE